MADPVNSSDVEALRKLLVYRVAAGAGEDDSVWRDSVWRAAYAKATETLAEFAAAVRTEAVAAERQRIREVAGRAWAQGTSRPVVSYVALQSFLDRLLADSEDDS